jgi:diguanylate cyclase (GGDEF)-like protein/PAS domain S-box-containing protein
MLSHVRVRHLRARLNRDALHAVAVPFWGSLGLAIAYFVAARVCVYLADTGKNPAAIWVPSGIALAALVYFGPRVWPGVFIGSFAANLVVELTLPSAILLALGNTLDVVVATWGIRRVAGKRLDFGRTRHALAYIAYAALIGPSISGLFGVAGLQMGGVFSSLSDDITGWVGWSLEDGLSVLIVSSVLLMARSSTWGWRDGRRLAESAALLVLLAANGWLIFSRDHNDPLSQPYLVLPLMLLIVLRLGAPGAVLGNLILTVLAGVTLVSGKGPFVLDTLPASMLWMQAFSAVMCLTTLLLAAALSEARSERYRQMFDGNRTIQLVLDARTGLVVDANPAACEFYGRSAEAMRTMSLGDVSSADRDVELHCNDIQINGRALTYTIVHDVSARRRAETALRQSEERFQLVARATNDTVWDWDIRTNLVWHNDAMHTVFGHATETNQVGLDWFLSRIHDDDRDAVVNDLRAATAQGATKWVHEYRFRRGDGSFAHVLARGYILYEDGTTARMVGVLFDLSERKRLEEELAHRATHDALTGLANRVLIESTLQQQVLGAQTTGATVALMIADLDHFKEINDTLGHQVGDLVLRIVAKRWRAVVGASHLVGRLAGDEFAVVLGNVGRAEAEFIAHELVRALEEPISVVDHQLRVGASVGLAMVPFDAADVQALTRCADQRMYESKRNGGGFILSRSDPSEPSWQAEEAA